MLKMRRFGLEPVPPETLAMLPVTPPPHKDALGGLEPPLTGVGEPTVQPLNIFPYYCVADLHGAFLSRGEGIPIPLHRTFVRI